VTPKPGTVATLSSIDRFARVCGFSPDAARLVALTTFESRLRPISPESRKLLAHAADLATRSHGAARKPNAAYLPELHETCGLDVDAMYHLLKELEDGGFVEIEGKYPFQDVMLGSDAQTGWPLIADLARFCAAEKIPLRDLIVDLRFDLLR
jgi:hypothetical protein